MRRWLMVRCRVHSGAGCGETIDTVTLTANGTPAGTAATAAVGPYTITPSAATGGTFNAANYAITYAPGALTVNPAPLTVTAGDQSKKYGATLVLNGATDFTPTGLQNGETVGAVTLTASGAPAGTAATAAAGPYTITPSAATGGTFNTANYAITFDPGTLTITAPAPLILPLRVTATNVVITWSAVSNGNYRVQFKPTLQAINWTDLVGDVLPTGSTASKTDALTTTNRFYQVQVVP